MRATDADSGATLSGWQIVSGNEAAIFSLDAATGVLSIANPLAIDFKKSSYTLSVTVSDGLRTSAAGSVKVKIPDKVKICHNGRTLQISRHAVNAHLRHGDCIGSCSRH